MFTLTVSFKPDEANVAVIAQIAQLLAQLETQSPVVTETQPILAVQEIVKAPRAKRVYTEAEKQAIRERLAAGRAKAALSRGEAVIPSPVAEVKPEQPKPLRVIEVNPDANHKSASIRPAPKPSAKKSVAKPMPIKGRKVEAKPSAQ